MPEVTITYKNTKTLEFLKDSSKYFDFVISKPKEKSVKKKETFLINGVTVIKGDSSIDTSEMSEIMARNNMDAKELRSR